MSDRSPKRSDARVRRGSWTALAVGATLIGCGAPKLNLGDSCSNKWVGNRDPCASAGLACEFAIDQDGGIGSTCQVPFGSVDGGIGKLCGQGSNTGTECTPYGLECTPTLGPDGGLTLSCQLPFIGRCAVNVGCTPGYLCLHDPTLGGELQCFQTCASSSDCLESSEHCVDSLGEHLCAIDACGGASGNGLPFEACDNAGMGDGYCYPNSSDGSGWCSATGLVGVDSLCRFDHSAFGCATGSMCTFGVEGPFGPTICLAACAVSGAQVHASDGGPGCATGQTCTQNLPFHFSGDPAGACVQDCAPDGGPACPMYTVCQPIEDGGYGCLN